MKYIICDIDETIAHDLNTAEIPQVNSREDWDLFHKAKFDYHPSGFKAKQDIVDMLKALCLSGDIGLIFVTAREDTFGGVIRLNSCRLINKLFDIPVPRVKLFMRKENDYSPSALVKEDILLHDILPVYDVLFAIDDDTSNCQMFRYHGITALQVR